MVAEPRSTAPTSNSNEKLDAGWNAPLVRNVTYNPSWAVDALTEVCNAQALDGFSLLRVVPVSQYEAVAVFTKPAESVAGEDR